jgi:hypothetical protein
MNTNNNINNINNNINNINNINNYNINNYRNIEIELSEFLYSYLLEIYENYKQYKINNPDDADNADGYGFTYIDYMFDDMEEVIMNEFNRYLYDLNYIRFLNNINISLPKELYNYLFIMINRMLDFNIKKIKHIELKDLYYDNNYNNSESSYLNNYNNIINIIAYFLYNNIFVHTDYDITYDNLYNTF